MGAASHRSRMSRRSTPTFGARSIQNGAATVAVRDRDAAPAAGTMLPLSTPDSGATAAPADPNALLPEYDSGDHLHPNDAGCEAIANAVDLRALLHR